MEDNMDKSAPSNTYLEKGEDGKLRMFRVPSARKGRRRPGFVPELPVMEDKVGEGKHIAILGGGVGGLTLAYELLKNTKYKVTIIEAKDKVGGRSLTLRPGDSFTEVVEVDGKTKEYTQKCEFAIEDENHPYPPYLNAGPGRIPSGHLNVLNFCKELGVAMEVYIMESRSNRYFFKEKDAETGTVEINRRIANDTRGHLSAELYRVEEEKKKAGDPNAAATQDLLLYFGSLQQADSEPGQEPAFKKGDYIGSNRAGYRELPGTQNGIPLAPLPLEELLKLKFWKHQFYQPEDWFWQATSFQPVGGMDMIEIALEKAILKMMKKGQRGRIVTGNPVERIRRDGEKWIISSAEEDMGIFDKCASNIPIPLLNGKVDVADFSPGYGHALKATMQSPGFLRPTCKVGWQAERNLWERIPPADTDNVVIPIFGGISYTSDPMTQMWYPSDRFNDRLGVLTGAYNYGGSATEWGKLSPEDRMDIARKNAENLHGPEFAKGLKKGITIAWQNIPTQKGGWADWKFVQVPEESAENMQTVYYNRLRQENNGFIIIGDQVSKLPGWKEGAMASALDAYGVFAEVQEFAPMQYDRVPDTEALIEGYKS